MIGVHKRGDKYWSWCSFGDGKVRWEGAFNTEYDAFVSYKNRKEAYIKAVADEYRNKFNDFFPPLKYIMRCMPIWYSLQIDFTRQQFDKLYESRAIIK